MQSIKDSANDLHLLANFLWLDNYFNLAARKVENIDLIEIPSQGDGESDDSE